MLVGGKLVPQVRFTNKGTTKTEPETTFTRLKRSYPCKFPVHGTLCGKS